MSVVRIYARVLDLLRPQARLVCILIIANLALAIAQFAEPILFGRIIDLMTRAQLLDANLLGTNLYRLYPPGLALASFQLAAILVGLNADRLAHRRRLAVMSEFFTHALRLPLTFHTNAHSGRLLKTMLDGAGAMFGLWLSFFEKTAPHLSPYLYSCP